MFAGGMALGAGMANAQDATATQGMQRVEVTGSRIPALNTEGSSPITTLSAKDIKADGPKNTEDLLNNLPQVFASQGAAISNGATGTATAAITTIAKPVLRCHLSVLAHQPPAGDHVYLGYGYSLPLMSIDRLSECVGKREAAADR